jgi:predicted dehydrogenase
VSERPTVGIVGLGYGRAHLAAFQAAGCRVIALCRRDEAAAREVADAAGVPQVYTRWTELLDRAAPEIVVVATPPHLHAAIVTEALARGAHVLCEKPLAFSVKEARELARVAALSGRVAMTSFNWRFPAAMQELHARVAEGHLGRAFHLAGRWLGGRWAAEDAAATWRMDRAQAAHGAMGDMGVHLVDLVRWTFGEFRRVAAQSGIAYPARSAPGVARPPDAEDWCAILAELADGTQLTLAVSRVAHGTLEHELEAYGSRGALRYRFAAARGVDRWWEGELRAARDGAGFERVAPRATPPPVEGGDHLEAVGRATVAPLVGRFLEGIRTRTTPSPTFEDGLRAQVVLEAVAEAAASGAWVEVPRG